MSLYQTIESSCIAAFRSSDRQARVAYLFSSVRPAVRGLKARLGLRTLAGLSAYSYAANRLWELGHYDAAIALHCQNIELHGESFDSLYELGRCHLKCDRPKDAVRIFEQAACHHSNNAAVWYQIGLSYFTLDKIPDALKALRTGLQYENTHIHTYLLIARVLRAAGNMQLAQEFAQQLVDDSKADEASGYALYVLAQVLLQQHQVSEAKQYLLDWQEKHPNNLLVRVCIGQIYEIEGQVQEAQTILDAVLTEALERFVGKGISYNRMHFVHMGRELYSMGLYSLAAFAFTRAHGMFETAFPFKLDYGRTLYKLERFEDALEAFEQAIVEDPKRKSDIQFEMARCYLRARKPEQALQELRSILEKDPKHFRAKVELARLHRNLGNFSEAKRWIVGVPPGVAEALRDVILGDLVVYEGNYLVNLKPEPDFVPENGKVLHVLETSLPHKTSGYTYRSHYILTNQKNHGYTVMATTRPGFPADVSAGEFTESSSKDGIFYKHNAIEGPANYNKQPLNFYLQAYSRNVLQAAREFSPELIHSASNFKNGLAACSAAKALDIPWTYELRGIWEDTQVSKGAITEESDRYKFFRAAETFCLQQANAVVTLSQTLKEEIASRGIAQEKIFVVPNAVDTDKFPVVTKNSDLVEKLGLGDGPVIGYISSLVAYEGIDLLIKSFAGLLKTKPGAKLLIVGGGDQFDSLQAQVKKLDLEGRAILTGRVPHDQVLNYYSLIDIFVVPRLPWRVCEIVTPLKPYEAMSTGRTVVVSDVSALKEMIIENKTGVSFKAGDPNSLKRTLQNLLEAPDMCSELAQNAAAWVRENRTWKMVTQEYQRAYDYALTSKNRTDQKKIANG